MQENWTSARGKFTGTSYNYYESSTQLWHQVWVDNQGGSLRLYGGMEDGKMVLRSDEVDSPQGKYINRIGKFRAGSTEGIRIVYFLPVSYGTANPIQI